MTILGTEFAVLLLLSGQGPDVERRLTAGCKRLEWEKRLTVFFRPLDGDVVAEDEKPGRLVEAVVTGVDKAGIVARIARTLADERVNVEDLHTELRPEPGSGTTIRTSRRTSWSPSRRTGASRSTSSSSGEGTPTTSRRPSSRRSPARSGTPWPKTPGSGASPRRRAACSGRQPLISVSAKDVS